MKYYYLYLKALINNRKEIRQMVHSHILSTGDLLDFKKSELMKLQKDFQNKVNYTPKTTLTVDDVKNYLNGEKTTINIPQLVKEKMMNP